MTNKLQKQDLEMISVVPGLLETQESQVWSLGWEDPLEQETATPSSFLAWKTPWTEDPGGLQSIGLQGVRHEWTNKREESVATFQFSTTLPPQKVLNHFFKNDFLRFFSNLKIPLYF